MSSDLILGFDTSAAHCAAALLSGDQVLGSVAQNMTRGQAEHLLPLIEPLLKGHNVTWRDLTRIGVGIGPGNFTGIRISVSAARGLALSLNIPAIGVSTFDAIALGSDNTPAVPAPRDQVYIYENGEHRLIPVKEAPTLLALPPIPRDHAIAIAKVARTKPVDAPPTPLYIRAADAAPSKDQPPVILP